MCRLSLLSDSRVVWPRRPPPCERAAQSSCRGPPRALSGLPRSGPTTYETRTALPDHSASGPCHTRPSGLPVIGARSRSRSLGSPRFAARTPFPLGMAAGTSVLTEFRKGSASRNSPPVVCRWDRGWAWRRGRRSVPPRTPSATVSSNSAVCHWRRRSALEELLRRALLRSRGSEEAGDSATHKTD